MDTTNLSGYSTYFHPDYMSVDNYGLKIEYTDPALVLQFIHAHVVDPDSGFRDALLSSCLDACYPNGCDLS